MAGKIKVPDANGNSKLDLFDVIIYYGTLGFNISMTLAKIISKFF